MSDFNPPPRKGPPGPPPRPHGAQTPEQPSAFSASDPDRTPINPSTAPIPIDPGLLHAPHEKTPAWSPSSAPMRPPSAPFSEASAERVNPFMVDAPAPPAPHNPAVAQSPAPQMPPPRPAMQTPPTVPIQPRPEAPAANPRLAPAPQVPAIVARPGVEIPQIKDPHAAFRRGNKLKGLAFVAIGAALLGGLFFLLPQEEEPRAQSPASAKKRDRPVIGSSVSPEIIKDPRDELLPDQTNQLPSDEPEPGPAPKSADNDGFANSFKSSAK